MFVFQELECLGGVDDGRFELFTRPVHQLQPRRLGLHRRQTGLGVADDVTDVVDHRHVQGAGEGRLPETVVLPHNVDEELLQHLQVSQFALSLSLALTTSVVLAAQVETDFSVGGRLGGRPVFEDGPRPVRAVSVAESCELAS